MKIMKEIKYVCEDFNDTSITPCVNFPSKVVAGPSCYQCRFFDSHNSLNRTVCCKYDEAIAEITKYSQPGQSTKQISKELYDRLEYLGIIDESGVRGRNFGASDYNEHTITVWSIWLDYPNLSEFEKMMIKYILREKDSDPKELDLEKVIHYAQERLRQLKVLKKQNK